MKIESIHISNFRLLKDFKLDLEDTLSLVLGKNNTGKTSILTCLEKFINSDSDKNKIKAEDFNLDYKKEIEKLITNPKQIENKEEYDKTLYGIKLRLVISYDEKDNTSNIFDLMMDLEPNHNKIVLGYEYSLHFNDYEEMRKEYKLFLTKEKSKQTEKSKLEPSKTYTPKTFEYFFKTNQDKYFKRRWKSIDYDYEQNLIIESNFNDLEKSKLKNNLKDIINFKYIDAKRGVTNKDNNKTLSTQTSEIYERSEKNDADEEKIQEFNAAIEETDEKLGKVYEGLFSETIDTVKEFGGIKKDESVIKIISTLQHKELLKGNTTVVYNHNETDFPEQYNGLGYMNLISMIFQIKILVSEFARKKDENPASINLLLIEEPEAHTHPQMQYVFIQNITNLLNKGIIKKDKDGNSLKPQPFQYIISTHSSHIVANCQDFNAIKYLKNEFVNDIKAKNLKDLEKEYLEEGEEGKKNYRFLKQYLTLNRAELFFADKAIFIEGDTERILLPAMMQKIDNEESIVENELKLLSQNISIVEVGAHSHIFEKFIDFIGVRSLIITDIDSYYEVQAKDEKTQQLKFKADGTTPKMEVIKCPANDTKADKTSNSSLRYYFGKTLNDLDFFKKLNIEGKILKREIDRKWKQNALGNLLIVYQTEEKAEKIYHARSFEDAFFHINYDFICNKKNSFQGLIAKWLKKFKSNKCAFTLAEKGVDKKPTLAIDILLNEKPDSQWQIPNYIREGLLWLRKD
ncbi:ATP-dependent endonuclease [Flavobacterium sediminilitoris]|uniref:ATP-dependent endonuclease n=1 Tax=Flavobacterium sediminilitoris TaxID=2024526 RepID=A0ABY4HKS9_9FLAO|nr:MULTISPECIES: ATP-dependent endonuclease [Flavobacterium]UOX33446.1 ATP-dependent endonuclease [Flavobacterium sediminilitoris]